MVAAITAEAAKPAEVRPLLWLLTETENARTGCPEQYAYVAYFDASETVRHASIRLWFDDGELTFAKPANMDTDAHDFLFADISNWREEKATSYLASHRFEVQSFGRDPNEVAAELRRRQCRVRHPAGCRCAS